MGGIFRMWCLALLVLLLCTHSWGSCGAYRSTYATGIQNVGVCQSAINNVQTSTRHVVCSEMVIQKDGTQQTGGSSCFACYFREGSTPVWGPRYDPACTWLNCVQCTTQAEADSVKCELDPTAEGCSNCKAADTTWYNNAVDSCNAIYGENNYSIVDTNDVCEHRGHCCSTDSTIAGNACTWKCESAASQCQPPLNFYSGILLDTTASDTGDVVQSRCYYNCIKYVPSDTTKAMVSGNILLAGPVSAMSQGTKVPNEFNSVRTTDNDTYIYDYLFPQAEHYLDSIAFTPCVKALYRGVLNGKYVYWYDGQAAPAGVSNIVKVK